MIETFIFIFQVENRIEREAETNFIVQTLSVSPDGAIILASSDKGLIQEQLLWRQ